MLFQLKDLGRSKQCVNRFRIQPEEDGNLLLMRELTVQGRNTCKVNGRSVTLSMLREISRHLVDIHGQHQHQSLLAAESHIDFLDRLGESELAELKAALVQTWSAWQTIRKEISRIEGLNQDGERRRDILLYQIEEIKNAALQPGEEDALRKERARLVHAEKIATTINDAYQKIYNSDSRTVSVLDGLADIVGQLQGIRGIDDVLDAIIGQLKAYITIWKILPGNSDHTGMFFILIPTGWSNWKPALRKYLPLSGSMEEL